MGILTEILIVIAIFLGLMGLGFALEDPCAGVKGWCAPIVDMRSAGRQMVAVALLIGVPAVSMAYLSRGHLDDD